MRLNGTVKQISSLKRYPYDTVPHYTTIASFISGHPKSVESIFEQILLTCDQQGLLGHELFAIDGCKMSSDASKEWSGTIKELKEKRNKIKKLINYHIYL